MLTLLALRVVISGVLLVGGFAEAAAATSDPLDRAQDLVDSYYGDPNLLSEASVLVQKSLAQAPTAHAYTLAARIAIKQGHIVSRQFLPGTINNSRDLIENALTIDPQYVPALSFMSELLILQGDVRGACETAQRAVRIDPNNSWIHVDLSECYARLHDRDSEFRERNIAAHAGPGTTKSQRRAYIAALLSEAKAIATPANAASMRQTAVLVENAMDPRDAWALGELAEDFESIGDYDDAAIYARKALHVMNYAAGRSILAAAYYGKAAQLKLAHQGYASILSQARSTEAPEELILEAFDWRGAPDEVARLLPIVKAMMEPRRRR